MSKLVHDPHDSFFKAIFSKKENVKAYLHHFLPAEVIKVIDINTINIENSSFVEESLKSYFSDMVYSVKIKESNENKNNGFIYILFEHKRYYSELIGFQLLKYMVNMFSSWLKQHKHAKRLPLVIPVVLYHGQGKFKVKPHFSALFNVKNKNLLKYIPDFEFLLTDLATKTDDELQAIEFVNAALGLLKHIQERDFIKKLPELLNLIVQNNPHIESVLVYFNYIISGVTNVDPDELLKTIKEKGGDVMPSLAQKLIDQGIQQGKIEGKREGKIEATKEVIGDMIEIKFDIQNPYITEQVQKITDLKFLFSLRKIIKKAKQIQEIEQFLRNLTLPEGS